MSAATDTNDFEALKTNLLNRKTDTDSQESAPKQPIEEKTVPIASKKEVKKAAFKKGDAVFEVDEDAELEIMADKKPIKLTLRDLKERASGDIAVKNRMHTLAEEKKKVQATLKDFASLAKEDPLRALEYISNKAKEADSEFAFDTYLAKLAEQAEKLGQMSESEKKAWELQNKLKSAEQELSVKEREAKAAERHREILQEYPEIRSEDFSKMVDAVLESPELSDGLKNEIDVLDRAEELLQNTLLQRDIMHTIATIDPHYQAEDELVFALADQIRANPDFDDEDVREIIREVVSPQTKQRTARILSEKQRAAMPVATMREQGASDFDILVQRLREDKETKKQKLKLG